MTALAEELAAELARVAVEAALAELDRWDLGPRSAQDPSPPSAIAVSSSWSLTPAGVRRLA